MPMHLQTIIQIPKDGSSLAVRTPASYGQRRSRPDPAVEGKAVRRQHSMRQIGRLRRESFWFIVTFTGAEMRQQTRSLKEPAEKVVANIRRDTRKNIRPRTSPHRAGGFAWRRQYRRAVPPRRDRAKPVLSLVENFLEAGKSAWLVTRLVRRPPTRSRVAA